MQTWDAFSAMERKGNPRPWRAHGRSEHLPRNGAREQYYRGLSLVQRDDEGRKYLHGA
ncbi:MAG: hypothetical protein RMI91_02750 [Gemmatales bacterium]|nr:hypothetical protein [Gemmatales bacterium]MDW7993547.1 hypothetical protein [Gemmatales bacterium]